MEEIVGAQRPVPTADNWRYGDGEGTWVALAGTAVLRNQRSI